MEKTINRQLALEMAMQDVLDNMTELSLDFAFGAGVECFEILSIEPAETPQPHVARRGGKRYRDIYSQNMVITRLRVA